MAAERVRGRLDGSEWRWAAAWAVVVAAVTAIPYVYGSLAAPPGHVFGGFIVNAIDGNSYLAKMREGYDGSWLYRLAFTPESQPGTFVFTLYLGLGHLARLTGLPAIGLFHVARMAAGVALLLAVYGLAAQLTTDVWARRWAFAVAAFGSGLGLISQLAGRGEVGFVPTDFYIPEVNTFYSILVNPHFPLMMACEVLSLLWVLHFPKPHWSLVAQFAVMAVIGTALVSMAPYLGPVAVVVVWVATLFARTRESAWRAAGVTLGAGGLLLYYLWALRADPVVAEWSRQNVTLSPPLLDTLMGLGLWLPLGAAAFWQWSRTREPGQRPWLAALALWIVLSLALMYVPYALQRRFAGGLFVPVSVLGGVGLHWLLGRAAGVWRAVMLAATIAFGFSTNALLLAVSLSTPHQNDNRTYLTADEANALRWIEAQDVSGQIVLADERLGNFVPGWTGARVVYGHPMETVDAETKRAQVAEYYAGNVDGGLLTLFDIRFIIGGPQPDGWQVMYESGTVTVYGR